MDSADDDLAERVAELEAALRDLQSELAAEETPRFPRIPSPLEVLRFSDEYAIPTAIAFLEAHIRALELLQGVIRLSGTGHTAQSADQHVERISETALRRLDALVSDLRSTPLPNNEEAKGIIEDAEALRYDLQTRLEASGRVREDATPVEIDVDEELDEIKADIRSEDEDDDQSSGSNR